MMKKVMNKNCQSHRPKTTSMLAEGSYGGGWLEVSASDIPNEIMNKLNNSFNKFIND